MAQTPPQADIFLERDSTRFQSNLEVAGISAPQQPTVRVDPAASSISVHRPTSTQEPGFTLQTAEGDSLATLRHRRTQSGSKGELVLRTTESPVHVDVESEPGWGAIRVKEDQTKRAEITSVTGPDQPLGGLISLHRSDETPGVVLQANPGANPGTASGLIEVFGQAGNPRARLLGSDAAVELRDWTGEGGNVLIQGAPPPGIETPPDVHVDFNRGTYQAPDNEARIYLDGETSRVKLGRRRLGTSRPSVTGEIRLNGDLDGSTETFLETGVRRLPSGNRVGEVLLRRKGSSGLEARGGIRATGDGLILETGPVSSSQSLSPALKADSNAQVAITGTITEGLADASPAFVESLLEVTQRQTTELELTVGDADTLVFQLTATTSVSYTLDATLKHYTDARLWLAIDTEAPTTSDQTVRIVSGDAQLSITNETSLSGPLPTGEYEYRIKTKGVSYWEDVGTLRVV